MLSQSLNGKGTACSTRFSGPNAQENSRMGEGREITKSYTPLYLNTGTILLSLTKHGKQLHNADKPRNINQTLQFAFFKLFQPSKP
jgi:hypothetical protein